MTGDPWDVTELDQLTRRWEAHVDDRLAVGRASDERLHEARASAIRRRGAPRYEIRARRHRSRPQSPRQQARWEEYLRSPRRRLLSLAYLRHFLFGLCWRVAWSLLLVFCLGFCVAREGLPLCLLALLASGLPGLFWRPWRVFWRWTLLSAAVAVLLPGSALYGRAVTTLLGAAPAGALAGARRWRLAGVQR